MTFQQQGRPGWRSISMGKKSREKQSSFSAVMQRLGLWIKWPWPRRASILNLMCSFHTIAFHECLNGRDVSKMLQCVNIHVTLVNFWMSGSWKMRDTNIILVQVLCCQLKWIIISCRLPTEKMWETLVICVSQTFKKGATTNKLRQCLRRRRSRVKLQTWKAAPRTSAGSAVGALIWPITKLENVAIYSCPSKRQHLWCMCRC